ncbi:MAG: AAA family ATPase [Spirochaetaceae bacterium]|nr:MAG: AAA family ATPase [Spirochaetaceae bacterium]
MKVPHGSRSDRLSVADDQWTLLLRAIFVLCADRLAPSDELAALAVSVADRPELCELVDRIGQSRERLKIEPDAIADLQEAVALAAPGTGPAGCTRLRDACLRLARRHDPVMPFMTDRILAMIRGAATDEPVPVPAIATEVGRLFSLGENETRILSALYVMESSGPLASALRNAPDWIVLSIIAAAAGVDTQEFVERTIPGGRLEQLGLIALRGGRDELADVGLSRPVLFCFRSNTLDDLSAGLFATTPAPRHAIDDFPLSDEEIRICSASIAGGYPILLSGDPGVGKTEFARSLVASLGLRAHTLAAVHDRSIDRGRAQSATTRVAAVRMAVGLLQRSRDVLIVDEADAILQSASDFLGLFGAGSYDKAELNDLLESLQVPSIWITNAHRMIPESALRRFAHVVDFPHPNAQIRTRMLAERIGPLAPDHAPDWIEALAAQYELTPAAIERTTRIVSAQIESQSIRAADVPSRVARYLRQTSGGALSHDIRRLPAVSAGFDPRFCSASESLDRIERLAVHRLQSGQSLRLLVGGPPGGGKTQYALWLARRLGRDVVLKRPSDLLSKWVGDSEKLIAAAFRDAERTGSVLVIDEADALLYDRDTAVRSWEHSQIAEFLQQIQEFEGILIACTNRVDGVDPALRRRFHKHLTFGPIATRATLEAALAHVFPNAAFSPDDLTALSRGPALMMSDLATATQMIAIDGDTDGDGLTDGGGSPSGGDGDGLTDGGELAVAPPAIRAAAASSRDIVREILANASARQPTRTIGF